LIVTLVIVDSVRMPRPPLLASAVLCTALYACSDGVGRPFTAAEYSGDAAVDAGPDEAEPAMTEADTGTKMPAPPRDASTAKPRDCRTLEDEWPDHDKRAARELFKRLDELRFENKSECGESSLRSWQPSSQLDCSARMRIEEEGVERWTATSPTFDFSDDPNETGKVVDRMERAGVQSARAGYELVISNADSVQSIVDAIEERVLCRLIWLPYSPLVGVSRSYHVWVVDFAPAPPPQGDPRPGPGGGH